MASWHRVGQRVVCIDDTYGEGWLHKGEIYVIRDLRSGPVDILFYFEGPPPWSSNVFGWFAHRFRPVKDTSLEVEKLKALLHKKPATEKLPIVAETDLADEWKPEELKA